MNVSPEEEVFTHTNIAAVLAEAGITYTMADKTSESVPLISIDEVNFLKRGFRYEPALDRHVAPIEEASISKLLHNIKGNGAPVEEVALGALQTANREYFLHGSDVFSKRHPELEQVGRRHFGAMFSLPNWVELTNDFLNETSVSAMPMSDDDDILLSPQSGEELRLLAAAVAVSKNKIRVNTNLSLGPIVLGEIDVIKHITSNILVIMEVKESPKYAHKARKQIKKYGQILDLLNHPCIMFTCCGGDAQLVGVTENFMKTAARNMDTWLTVESYLCNELQIHIEDLM
jgi:hypothetical protein